MIKRVTIKDWRVTLTVAKVARVIGVNSNLENGNHIIMWDFDDQELANVRAALKRVQRKYKLPDIHVLMSKENANYMAYCFKSKCWRDTVLIVADTSLVDWQFFRFGVYRSHWTLRVTPKNFRTPKLIDILEGYTEPDVKPSDLTSWVKYETLSWR